MNWYTIPSSRGELRSFLYLSVYIRTRSLIFKNIQLNEKCLLARRAYYNTKQLLVVLHRRGKLFRILLNNATRHMNAIYNVKNRAFFANIKLFPTATKRLANNE